MKLTYKLNDLKRVVKKHLLLNDYTIIDVIAAVVVANRFPMDPLWLLIVGPSSSAKTELLDVLDPLREICSLSDLTKSTLISGKDGSSLLPHLKNKIIVMKDFTTILSKKPDDLKIIMSQLREVYDGKLIKAFGTGRVEKWEGHVGFIGACTAAYDRHYSVIGQMGERFLLYRLKNMDDLKTGLKALRGWGSESGFRKDFQEAFRKFFGQFDKMKVTVKKPSEDLAYKIVSLATFCGHGRCPVHRDRFSKEVTYLPDPEGTPRLTKQLYHLAIGLTKVRGDPAITDGIYQIIKKVARDLIPKMRLVILRHLYETRATEINNEWLKTTEIARGVGIHGKTTLRILEDLEIVKLLRSRWLEDDQGQPYEWQINEKALETIGGSEIFDE